MASQRRSVATYQYLSDRLRSKGAKVIETLRTTTQSVIQDWLALTNCLEISHVTGFYRDRYS